MGQPVAVQAAPVFFKLILASRQKPPVLAGQSETMPASAVATMGTFSMTANATCVCAAIASTTACVIAVGPPSPMPPSLPPVPVPPPPPVPFDPPLPPPPAVVVAVVDVSSPPQATIANEDTSAQVRSFRFMGSPPSI